MTRVDWLIVGAGFTGATLAERIASQLDQSVMVVDRRAHLAGNAYDETDENGILFHRYGPHIFHTNSERVWNHLSGFTTWRPYEHQVLGVIDGKRVPIPFNLNSLEALYPERLRTRLEGLLLERYGLNAKVPILVLRESDDPDLRSLADFIYEKVFYGYTLKQWGMRPEDLDPSVTGRVPVLVGRDNRYFQDRFQAMPSDGYTRLFERLLSHPRIAVVLGADYRVVKDDVSFRRMVYTGPIDELCEYRHGALPYRSIRFERVALDREWFQEVGTVNYPNQEAFTRITEQKHLTGQVHPMTLLTYEFPEAHQPGTNEPYYPVPREENRLIHERYLQEAGEMHPGLVFAGRLADYKYYNMDQAVARALTLFDSVMAK